MVPLPPVVAGDGALTVMLPALALLRRHAVHDRVLLIILSAIVAHTGWHWSLERIEVLRKVEWPSPDVAGLLVLARWIVGVLLVAGAMSYIVKRIREQRPPPLAFLERDLPD